MARTKKAESASAEPQLRMDKRQQKLPPVQMAEVVAHLAMRELTRSGVIQTPFDDDALPSLADFLHRMGHLTEAQRKEVEESVIPF